jgi:2-polyprenyl-3-methyl-5-hydroxy-6-metoxy-1,4-benzoquinol methylase
MGYKLIEHYGLSDYSLAAVGKLNPPKTWHILDVGSGAGQLLMMLKNLGYTNLTGIDPYANRSTYPVEIKNIHLADLPDHETFDLIMFHHSFEHTPDPIETLLTAKQHLRKDGVILIRTPLISYAFEKYQENWFQLDAPRHLHLQSLKSIRMMLEKTGLKLKDLYCDSRDEQFYVSENYVKNISMKEARRSPLNALVHVLFSSERSKFRKEAKKLNAQLMGDSVAYYITQE